MLASMNFEVQKQHEMMASLSVIVHIKELFDTQIRSERYETSKELFWCKMVEQSSISVNIQLMIGFIEKLAQLGYVQDNE